jgi:hypothetical protein
MTGLFFIAGGILMLAFFVLGAIAAVKHHKPKLSKSAQKYVTSHWYRILDSVEADAKHAVMEADKLLDYVFERRVGGAAKGLRLSLGEKLKKHKGHFSDLNGVWDAHKLRNKIAHEMGFKVSHKEAKIALGRFKKALMDLGATLK